MGTKASTIINDDMTLEEKLAAIDKMMADAVAAAAATSEADGSAAVPVDPADLTICDGCQ